MAPLNVFASRKWRLDCERNDCKSACLTLRTLKPRMLPTMGPEIKPENFEQFDSDSPLVNTGAELKHRLLVGFSEELSQSGD